MRTIITLLLPMCILLLYPLLGNAQAPDAPGGHDQIALKNLMESIKDIDQKVFSLKERHWFRDFGPTVVSFFSLLLALGTIFLTEKHNRRTLRERSREEERKSIREKLDQFYGPLQHLRGVSKNLYSIFLSRRTAQDHAAYPGTTGRFAVLLAFIQGKVFEGVDAVLLSKIVEIGNRSSELISEKVGLVDDPQLRDILWKLAAHYQIIALASEGKLVGGGKEFEQFTFPFQIDEKLEQEVNKLNDRLNKLQRVT